MKVLVYSNHGYDKLFLEKEAHNKHELIYSEKALREDTVELANGCEAIALFSNDKASAQVLDKLSELGIKHIALRSVGYDHVDLQHAKQLGIKVANVPEYSPYAIAEHGVALILALNRKLFKAQELIQQQDFRLDPLVGFDFNGKTVGIVGTGKIGRAFARIMKGFGCKVIAYDIEENQESKDLGIKYTSLENLLKSSDVVSLNCPLNEHTKYLIDAPQLELMKKESILLNTARGGVVNTNSLITSLKNGHLKGACLDVYEKEKGLYFYDHRDTNIEDEVFNTLLSLDNVILTGHQAFLTQEALEGIAKTTVENLNFWSEGKSSPNEVT